MPGGQCGCQRNENPWQETVGDRVQWRRRGPVLEQVRTTVARPVPGGVDDQGGNQDDPKPLVGEAAEDEVQQRNEQQQDQELTELDAEVEGEQRGQEVRAGELERLAEGEGEAEAVDEAEAEGGGPATFLADAEDVLERHVDDGQRDQDLDQGGEPENARRQTGGGGDQGDRVGDRERGDDEDQLAELAERGDEADQKQQVVETAEDVFEAHRHEVEAGLCPVGIEPHAARLGGKLENPRVAVGGLKAEHGEHAQAEAAEAGVDRESWPLLCGHGVERCFEQHVQERLPPYELRGRRQRRAADVLQGAA